MNLLKAINNKFTKINALNRGNVSIILFIYALQLDIALAKCQRATIQNKY